VLEGLLPAGTAPWLGWMILAVLLGLGEIVVPGVFLFWIAIAAAITGAVVFLAPIALPAQVILFAILCLASVYLGRRWYRDNPVPSSDPLLNDRAARLVGRKVTVVDPIVNGEGRVRIDDGTWTAIGPDAPAGAQLTVVEAHGATLTVAWPAA
jgi:membrane protein implicated in regulation of membrane protease activity